jgi:hypothetical protein
LSNPRGKRSPFLNEDEFENDAYKVDVLYFVNPKGRCPVEDDFLNTKQVPKKKKLQLAALIIRYAREGEINNEQRCHRLKGRVRDFWVFKRHQHRIYFFKDTERRIIITHGIVKQEDELRIEEEERMLFIRDTYNNLTLYK